MTVADRPLAPAPKTTTSSTAGRYLYPLYEYALPLLLFGVLTLALTWPTVRDFSSKLVSVGGDSRHNLWVLWHYKEALLGRTALFSTDLLYYPQGASLLTHGLGPVMALFALPFWPWGAVAAHNGAVLVGFGLTGFFMYLLARGLGLPRGPAIFAGLLLLTAPMHMAGLLGHMTKVFLGLIPLSLLAIHHGLNPERKLGWAVAAAALLLATLLHSGYQFIFTMILVGLYGIMMMLTANPDNRPAVFKRVLILAGAWLVIAGPMLFLTMQASETANISVNRSQESVIYQPDAAEFFVPYQYTWLLGLQTADFLGQFDVRPSIESTVSLSFAGLLLAAVVLLKGPKEGRWWLLFSLVFAVLALGPVLKLLGQRTFTTSEFSITLPYSLLTQMPGMGFMRVPGRFMMVGFVTFAVTAAFGLAWLAGRFPRLATPIVVAASLLVLAERWPYPWPQEVLRPVPQFYQDLAADPDFYGVFDLPVSDNQLPDAYIPYSSYYQMYQMTHGKGIASGYLSRVYDTHPLFPCVIPELLPVQPDVLVNGVPSRCDANFLFDLAYFNYRYVAWHQPDPSFRHYKPDSWADETTTAFVNDRFGDLAPLMEDELVTIYAVPSLAEAAAGLSPSIGLIENWYDNPNNDWRWAKSPASLYISMPRAQAATLELATAAAFNPDPERNGQGVLQVAVDGVQMAPLAISAGQITAIPLELAAGPHVVTLSLEAGNFFPSDYGSADPRELSFAVSSVNLVTNE